MSEQPSPSSEQSAQTAPTAGQPVAASASEAQTASAQEPTLQTQQQPALAERVTAIADEKPEMAAGAAFAAGFLFAMILRRFAR